MSPTSSAGRHSGHGIVTEKTQTIRTGGEKISVRYGEIHLPRSDSWKPLEDVTARANAAVLVIGGDRWSEDIECSDEVEATEVATQINEAVQKWNDEVDQLDEAGQLTVKKESERKAVLAQNVASYVHAGWGVEAQSDFQAVVV
jgi:hypothetical protein